MILDPMEQLRHDLANEREAVIRWRAVAERRHHDSPVLSGIPAWARVVALVGLPGFIALYLLGAMPFLPSPIHKIQDALAAARTDMHAHAIQTEALLRATRQSCRGVWRGLPEMQDECGR